VALPDDQIEALLNDFDAREVLHVTFGSALATHGADLLQFLRAHENAYGDALETHFVRHLVPFAQSSVPVES
jgi:hypothetical protein